MSHWQTYHCTTGQILTRFNLYFFAKKRILAIWSGFGTPGKTSERPRQEWCVVGQVYKVIMQAIAGDNSGSLNIGGFLQNFSLSVNFCRYCEIDRITFLADSLCRENLQNLTKSIFRDLKRVQSTVEVSNLTPCSVSCPSFMYVSLYCLHLLAMICLKVLQPLILRYTFGNW